MKKVTLDPGITVFPMPAAVISVGKGDEANLIALAYVGKVCLEPPIVVISIQPKRHSYHLIEKHSEFVINYPTIDQLKEIDYCGTRSGRNVNKWKELNLTKEQASIVQVPMIKEFPWNVECKVINRIKLASSPFPTEITAAGIGKTVIPGSRVTFCIFKFPSYFILILAK